jgi:predicted alpha/beta superfamily hydrolase
MRVLEAKSALMRVILTGMATLGACHLDAPIDSQSVAPGESASGANDDGQAPGNESDVASATIRVHYDVGFGNSILIQGDAAGLTWDSGALATWTSGNIWEFETAPFEGVALFKPVIEDEAGAIVWAKGADYRIEAGATLEIYPFFYSEAGTQETLTIPSNIYGTERTVEIYLPPSYDEAGAADRQYPVFFFLDGQNLFDSNAFFGGWRLGESLDLLYTQSAVETSDGEIRLGRPIRDVVIVAPHNSPNRIYEYTPTNASFGECDAALENCGGGGNAQLDFLLEELLVSLQSSHRLSGDISGIGGSSLGGLLALHACWSQPESFSTCAVLSPSLWWDNRLLLEDISSAQNEEIEPLLYLDVGTEEGAFSDVLELNEIWSAQAANRPDLTASPHLCLVGEGHGHQETAWRTRAPFAMAYLFADSNRVSDPSDLPSDLTHCSAWEESP